MSHYEMGPRAARTLKAGLEALLRQQLEDVTDADVEEWWGHFVREEWPAAIASGLAPPAEGEGAASALARWFEPLWLTLNIALVTVVMREDVAAGRTEEVREMGPGGKVAKVWYRDKE
jgi:hypothetical protein